MGENLKECFQLRQQLAASQAREKRLRDALEKLPEKIVMQLEGMASEQAMMVVYRVGEESYPIQTTDDTALREYCAGVVLKVGEYWFSKKDGAGTFEEIADKIRKGEAL